MSEIAGVDLEDVLVWIAKYRRARGYPPSRRELSAQFGVSLETTQRLLHQMVEEGLLVVTPGVSRAINVTGAAMKIISEDL